MQGKGILEYLDGKKWAKVVVNQEISKSNIDAKKMRFKTQASGFANLYASFYFKVNDGTDYSKKAKFHTERKTFLKAAGIKTN